MEERDSPAGDNNTEPLQPLPLPPGRSETYIVQIPRDQIYRVPPPENAQIVESYRKGTPKNKKKHCHICTCIVAFLVAIALGIGGVIAFILLAYNPKSPEFSIAQIRANNLSSLSDNGNGMHTQYPISIMFKNLNKKMDVRYEVGTMTLMYKGKKIAKGKSPSMHQVAGKESKVYETLKGTNEEMPNWLPKSLVDKNPKSMTLMIEMPIKVTSWVRNMKEELRVTCDLKVDTLGKGTKILSEKCRNN